MKKSILNLGKTLNKAKQTTILGGNPLILKPTKLAGQCKDVCPSVTQEIKCGPPHCPGVCDGRGGFFLY